MMMAQRSQAMVFATALILGLARAQNGTGSVTDLASYMTHINATRNDSSPVVLNIDTQDTTKRNATAPYLYGLMHEDISHSGDGGQTKSPELHRVMLMIGSCRHIRRASRESSLPGFELEYHELARLQW